jgi:hypothetical protein
MSSYFSLDDVLAEESAIACLFKTEVEDLGLLDSGSRQKHLPVGAKVSLPLWLSTALYLENAVDIELPAAYGKNFSSQLSADPKVMALGSLPHYYEAGAKLARLVEAREHDRICKAMMLAFSQRFVDIFRHAQNWRERDMSELSKKYSESEMKLFHEEYKAATDLEKWKDSPIVHYVASPLALLDEPLPNALVALPGTERDSKRIRH